MKIIGRALVAVVLTLVVLTPVEVHATLNDSAANSPTSDGSVVWRWNQVAMDVLTPSGRPLTTQPFVLGDWCQTGR